MALLNFISKSFNHIYLMHILIILAFFVKKTCLQAPPNNNIFLKAVKLPSGEFFIVLNNGIYIYESNFTIYKCIYPFGDNEMIDGESNILIEEIEDNNNVYTLTLIDGNNLYIFNYNNDKVSRQELNINKIAKFYNLLPYEVNQSVVQCAICFISLYSEVYYFNFLNYEINLLYNSISKTFDSYYTNTIMDFFFPVQITKSSDFWKLTCFYFGKQEEFPYNTQLRVDNYIINNTNFQFYYLLYDYSVNSITEIKSSLPNDEKQCLVCYRDLTNLYCIIYDIEENNYVYDNSHPNSIIKYTINFCIKSELYYFKESNQYIVICNTYQNYNNYQFKALILDNNFKKSEICHANEITFEITSCQKINNFSLIYSNVDKSYGLINDCERGSNSFVMYNHSVFKSNYCPNDDFPSDSLSETSSPSSSYLNIYYSIYPQYCSIPEIFISTQISEISDSILHSDILLISDTYSSKISDINTISHSDILLISDIYSSKISDINTIYNVNNDYSEIPQKKEIELEEFDIRKIKKEELIANIKKIMDSVDIGKTYEYKGDGYDLIITPTDSTFFENSTHINFSECEETLRKVYNLPSSSILTLFQIEIKNENEKSLVNNVEYQIYNENKTLLDLSLCNDNNIQVFYSLKENSIDISSFSSFKDSGIDILNINDSFFNDICQPYSDPDSNDDVVLEDRIKFIFQNYSLCDEGCEYNDIDLDTKIISCDCKVKTNVSIIDNYTLTLKKFDDINIESNFGLIKCYKLVFSLRGKSKNIGFWIFLLLTLAHIPLLVHFFHKGIKSIKEYILNEMEENGYITKSKNKANKNKNKIINSPPIKGHSSKNVNNKSTKRKINNKNNAEETSSKKGIIEQKNNFIILNINNGKDTNNKSIKNKKKKTKENTSRKKKDKKINLLSTEDIDNHSNSNTKKENNISNYGIISINLNNIRNNTPKSSSHILNNYTYEEAIKYDMRQICVIFYIFLLSKQAAFHAFLYRSPLELFSLRMCLFLFIISSDLALNAFFYLDDKISKKFRNAQNLFLFTFNNNITIILLSTLIGFIFMTLFTNLSNSTNSIRDIFKKEEQNINRNKNKNKKNTKYIIDEKRKKEILSEIDKILNKHKIKVIILIVIEISLILFFWYYVTAFCHVYHSTQLSWLFNSFLSMLSRLVVEVLTSLLFAKLYRMAVEANIKCLYKIVLFFYCFG